MLSPDVDHSARIPQTGSLSWKVLRDERKMRCQLVNAFGNANIQRSQMQKAGVIPQSAGLSWKVLRDRRDVAIKASPSTLADSSMTPRTSEVHETRDAGPVAAQSAMSQQGPSRPSAASVMSVRPSVRCERQMLKTDSLPRWFHKEPIGGDDWTRDHSTYLTTLGISAQNHLCDPVPDTSLLRLSRLNREPSVRRRADKVIATTNATARERIQPKTGLSSPRYRTRDQSSLLMSHKLTDLASSSPNSSFARALACYSET